MAPKQEHLPDISRRRFCTLIIHSATTLIGALTVLPGIGLLLTPAWTRKERRRLKAVFLNPADAHSPPIALARLEGQESTEAGVFIRRNPDGTILALSARCSHAGCPVEWNESAQQFVCPCHKGKYDANGRNIAGPPKRPLERLPAEMVNGEIYVLEPKG